MVYSPDGKYLLTGTTANLIGEGGLGYQWDVATGNKLRTFPNHKKGIPAVAWSADGKLLATAGWDNVVSLFNADTGTLLTEIKEPATIIAVAFSPDTKTIAAAGGTDDTGPRRGDRNR
jgi:WD40 repeat protein